MAQPPAYNRNADFTKNHGSTQNDSLLNGEFNDVSSSINAIRENIAMIQDDDGGLKEGIVTKENFTTAAYNELVDDVTEQVQPQIDTIQGYADTAQQAATASAASAASAAQDAATASAAAVNAANSAASSAQTATNIQENLPSTIDAYVTSLDLPSQIEDEVREQLDDLAVDERLNQNLALVQEGLNQIPQDVANAVSAQDIPSQVEDEVNETLTAAIVEGMTEALGYTVANDADVVKHTSQDLTTLQKAQARTNIGAPSTADVDGKVSISGGNASATVATATGSTTARTLADWMKDVSENHRTTKPLVLVVAGQSNAVGSTGGTGSAYRSSITVSTGGYWNNDTGEWVSGVADPVYPTNSGSFIPSLCKTLTEKTGRPVYVINVAKSDTVTASQNDNHTADQKWSSNGTLRTRALQMVDTALAKLDVPYELLGTVWMQGESDATGLINPVDSETKHETLEDYSASILDTVGWFKQNIGGEFFCVPIAYDSVTSVDIYCDQVNQALLSAARSYDAVVVGSDFTKYARANGYLRDTYHFTVAGYDILGGEIAEDISKAILKDFVNSKKIAFVTDFKFPDYDDVIQIVESLTSYTGTQNIWACGASFFTKDNVKYLFIFSRLQGGTGTSTIGIITVYNFETGLYLGYYLISDNVTTQGLEVRTENGTDYIYSVNSSNQLVKYPFALGDFYSDTSTVLTGTVVTDGNSNPVPAGVYVSYANGVWCIDESNYRNAITGQKALTLYDDSFNKIGNFYLPTFLHDKWSSYTAAASDRANQWSLPKMQGIEIGYDGIYFFKGGGTSATTTTYRLTDVGVDHYNFNGDLVRSSVCNHTEYVKRMNGLLGLPASNIHSESEGGIIDDDGYVYQFTIVGGNTGKLILTQEFSVADDAVEFVDCLANYYSDIPSLCNVPQLPRGVSGTYYNPFTGAELTSIDDVVFMCAYFGIDLLTFSMYGQSGWSMTVGGVDISIPGSYPRNCVLEVRKFTNGYYWLTVYAGAGATRPTTYILTLNSSYAITNCVKQDLKDGYVEVTSNNYGDYALPLTGGTLSGDLAGSATTFVVQKTNTSGSVRVSGGTSASNGGATILYGAGHSSAGQFRIRSATSSSTIKDLIGKPDGTLTWDGQSIQTTSDARKKTSISDVPDNILDAWGDVNWGQFQYLEAVKAKGNSARFHLGLIAQRVKDVFESHGLDACSYGILCHEVWEDEVDEEGNFIRSAGDLWMVRYEEAQAMEAAYQRRRADRIEARLEALEERMR